MNVSTCKHKDRPTLNKGRFKKNHQPWNKGMKGTHFSLSTEFKKGNKPRSWRPVGTVSIKKNKEDSARAYVKTAEPNIWRSRSVLEWEKVNGPLPSGIIIHHEDRDTLNDDPDNLTAFTRAEHLTQHRKEHDEKRNATLKNFWKNNPKKNILRISKSLRSRYGDVCADRYIDKMLKSGGSYENEDGSQ